MISFCSPAIIYVIFSMTQIIIDLYKGLFNTALVKGFVMIMVTLLLNILCERGLGVISWIIVFIPFILMTVIVTLLLYFFGLNATSGYLHYNKQIQPQQHYYIYPDTANINSYNNKNLNTNTTPPPPLNFSSSPAFQNV
jgi:hypothetical protein